MGNAEPLPCEETMENTPSRTQEAQAVDSESERDRRRAALARWRGAKTSGTHSESCRGSAWTHQRRQCAADTGDGRSGEIRTPDPLLPKQVRYQAALRSARVYRGVAIARQPHRLLLQ